MDGVLDVPHCVVRLQTGVLRWIANPFVIVFSLLLLSFFSKRPHFVTNVQVLVQLWLSENHLSGVQGPEDPLESPDVGF